LIDGHPDSGLSVAHRLDGFGARRNKHAQAEHNMASIANQAGVSTENVITESITCANGMPAFLAHPAGAARLPAIILMHERYGLVRHTMDQAIRCVRDGFAVLAPNFFFKHPDQRKLNAGDARCDLTDPESVAYLKAAIATLKKYKVADPKRLAVAGYCQTGRHPLVLAAEVPISAAVVWYGAASKREWEANEIQPRPLDAVIAAINCPVFGAFGEADHIISIADVLRFRNCLEAHRKSYDIHVYEGAPHGWLNDTMPGRYRKAEAQAGWTAQQRFLADVFGGGYTNKTVRWSFACESGHDYDFSKNVRLE
jgi:carboxymethylenebutenolidase